MLEAASRSLCQAHPSHCWTAASQKHLRAAHSMFKFCCSAHQDMWTCIATDRHWNHRAFFCNARGCDAHVNAGMQLARDSMAENITPSRLLMYACTNSTKQRIKAAEKTTSVSLLCKIVSVASTRHQVTCSFLCLACIFGARNRHSALANRPVDGHLCYSDTEPVCSFESHPAFGNHTYICNTS